MTDKDKGLYKKYIVSRTDGQSDTGQKHEDCEYFVLDLTHDIHALVAYQAYADSCRKGLPRLADDIDAFFDRKAEKIGKTFGDDGQGR